MPALDREASPSTRCLVASIALVGYTYIGFPLLVFVRGRFRPRPWIRGGPATPPVSVVIAAHNEQGAIGDKIRSVLESQYPPGLIEVIVASDGSTDSTVGCVEAVGDDRVVILDLPRVGKASALDAAISRSNHEILVFTDANSRLAPDALRHLVEPFQDHEVGGVAGDQRYERQAPEASGIEVGERRYWSFDRAVKRAESAAGNVISATGALYAVRRELCPEVPVGVTDDFAISTAVIAAGKRLVFAERACAFEPPSTSSGREFDRKVRIMTRGLRGVWLRRQLLDPRRSGFYAVQLWSHKVLRRLMILPLLVALLASLVASRRSTVVRWIAGGQLVFYGLGAIGFVLPTARHRWSRALSIPSYFLMVNAAALVALSNLLRGRSIDRWQPTSSDTRPSDPSRP